MTAVFVHGVPETSRIWDQVRARVTSESVAVELPGFGVPRPDGFGATADDYVQWLVTRLRELDGPVDLVGHDWGALLVARVVTTQSVPVRSWALDVASILHPGYVWHDIAQLWQTAGDGEEWLNNTLDASQGDSAAAQLAVAGAPAAAAQSMGEQFDEIMGRSILDLYRSATPNVHAHWGPELSCATAVPGLVIQPAGDAFDDQPVSDEMAARLGARTWRFEGLGHWWMVEDPAAAAAALQRFWSSIGDR